MLWGERHGDRRVGCRILAGVVQKDPHDAAEPFGVAPHMDAVGAREIDDTALLEGDGIKLQGRRFDELREVYVVVPEGELGPVDALVRAFELEELTDELTHEVGFLGRALYPASLPLGDCLLYTSPSPRDTR